MRTFVPWRFGAVTALTVMLGYLACTALWLLFTEPSMAFMNALFHGVDFRPLYSGRAFDAGSWLGAVVVLSTWGFLIGALFALLVNRLRVERPAA
jgi:hypothetical protein